MDQTHIGYLIKSINDKLKTKADEDLKMHNLTLSQSRVVALLSAKNGSATQKELEDVLGVSHPTVVGLVSRMEQNGIVRTFFDGNDRSKTVELTDYAHALGKSMEETINEHENSLLENFTDDEADSLRTLLKKLLANLDK